MVGIQSNPFVEISVKGLSSQQMVSRLIPLWIWAQESRQLIVSIWKSSQFHGGIWLLTDGFDKDEEDKETVT